MKKRLSSQFKVDSPPAAFTATELRKLRSLKTPQGIQRALDKMPYHVANTAWSPRRVLAENSAHCFEGALFAAAALRANGYPPLLFDLEAERDTDHVIAIYKQKGHWGALAKSNFSGCRGRDPVYRTLRELAMSYFHGYFNLRKERTLRRFSVPFNLKYFDSRNWMTTEKPVWFVAEHLFTIRHFALLKNGVEKNLSRIDDRLFRGECVDRAIK